MTKTQNMKTMMVSLAEVELTESPVISCMVDLTQTHFHAAEELEINANLLTKSLKTNEKSLFNEAVEKIKSYILNTSLPAAKGLAIYARVGEDPFLYALPLGVKVSSSVVVDELPHIYPLVETMDTYHHFLMVTLTEKEAHIYETSAGAITSEILTEKPELRSKIGREWTRERYHNHKEDRQLRFIQSKINLLDELVNKSEHSHIIIAGSPKVVSNFTNALPTHLKNKVIDVMDMNPKTGIDPILVNAMKSFVDNETEESHDKVAELESEYMRGGLGVIGEMVTKHALNFGYAETLVISQDYPVTMKEELVRMAVLADLEIETVKDNETLNLLGGVGCILRYRPSNIKEIVELSHEKTH